MSDKDVSTSGNANVWRKTLIHPPILLSVFPIFGMMLLRWSTAKWGIATSFDSAVYIATAENLLQGHGVDILLSTGRTLPQLHFPPLYPMAIATFMALGLDRLSAPTWLNIILFGANIAMLEWIVHETTRSKGGAALAGFLALMSEPFVHFHTLALSEPLFIFLGLAGIRFTAAYIDGRNIFNLICAATLFAMSLLTRHAGVAFIAAGALAVMIHERREFKRAVRDAGVVLAAGVIPSLAWTLSHPSTLALYFSSGGRKLEWHAPGLSKILTLGNTVVQWLLPGRVPFQLKVLLAATLLVTSAYILATRWRKMMEAVSKLVDDPKKALLTELLIFPFTYAAVLFFSMLFVDAMIPFAPRLLLPVYVVLLPLAIHGASLVTGERRDGFLRGFLIAAAIACLALLSLKSTVGELLTLGSSGGGETGAAARGSGIIAFLGNLPEKTAIYANAPAPIYLLTGKRPDFPPNKINPCSGIENPKFNSELDALKHRLGTGCVVVFFNNAPCDPHAKFYLSEEELLLETNVRIIMRDGLGRVYGVPEAMPWLKKPY